MIKKKYIKRERVEIPYELKDESLWGIAMKFGRSLMQSHCGQRLKVKVGS